MSTEAQVTEAPPSAAAAEAGAARGHGCDVLIADDSGAAREILASLLRHHSVTLEIRQARDGETALAAFEEHRPRVTFLDIDMPARSGLEVLEIIRRSHTTDFIVIVSGNSSADNVKQALAMGASGFIVKPYKAQRLDDMLRRYATVSGHRFDARH